MDNKVKNLSIDDAKREELLPPITDENQIDKRLLPSLKESEA